jgi:hypothetical protein
VVHNRPIVTRFQDHSVQDLSDWSVVIPRTPGYPHDGEAHGDEFWISCVSGLLVAYAIEKGRITSREVDRIDLVANTGHSGWCRGLIVTDDLFVISLTTIQERPGNRWCDLPTENTETSVLAVCRRSRRLVARVDLSRYGRWSKVFTVLPMRSTAGLPPARGR